jgi:hypothetical protein
MSDFEQIHSVAPFENDPQIIEPDSEVAADSTDVSCSGVDVQEPCIPLPPPEKVPDWLVAARLGKDALSAGEVSGTSSLDENVLLTDGEIRFNRQIAQALGERTRLPIYRRPRHKTPRHQT